MNTFANLHSNLFQTIVYFNYNHFEIELWLDNSDDVEGATPEILETLENNVMERVFVQSLALWNMAKTLELDFIDFSHFQLLPEPLPNKQRFYSVKFPIHMPLTYGTHGTSLTHITQTSMENHKTNGTELNQLLAYIQKNKYFQNVNERNYIELFQRLKMKYSFSRIQAYLYKYDEFASALLNAYPIDELKNNANIKIKIKTSDTIQEKIVKRHLYRNYASEDIFFMDIGNHSPDGDLSQCIAKIISEPTGKGNDSSMSNNDPVSIIQRLDLFLRKSAFKSFVLIIDHLKSKEDIEFINYLVHSSGIANIILIVFDTASSSRGSAGSAISSSNPVEFDLVLNENPRNLLEDYLQFDKPGVKTTDLFRKTGIPDSIESFNTRLTYYVKSGQVKELNKLLKKYLLVELEPHEHSDIEKIDLTGIKTFLVENLNLLEKKAENIENIESIKSGESAYETRRFLVEILIKEGDTDLATVLIRDHAEKDPVFLKLKLAQVYRIEKNHPRMHSLLEEIRKDISEPWLDEFNYLNYIYYEKILALKSADRYLKKIKKPLFVHLANVKLSDRYIYEGNFKKAGQILTEAAAYLEEKKYLADEIEARSQYAKLLRQKKEFNEAEKLYKNLFIKSEMNHFRLFSAYISVDLGNLYFAGDDFTQAEVWYRKALKIFQNVKNKNGIMLAESNLVEINKIKGNWQETERYLKSILAYDKERKSLDSMAIDYINIAHLEYLKHNEVGAREFLQKAMDLFEKRKNAAGIIECELLNLKLSYLFSGASSAINENLSTMSVIPGKYREYMTTDQEIIFSIFDMLMAKGGRSTHQAGFAKNILEKIEQIQSRLFRFEVLSLWILAGCPRKPDLLEILKSLSMQLCMKTKNYHFYEYYYIYFNDRAQKEKSNDNLGILEMNGTDSHNREKDIFMDTYYFFLRNKRRLTPAIIKYKNRLDEKDSVYDMFRNVELVEDASLWKMPGDFFNTLVKELKKIIPVDRIQLDIYENTTNTTPVFHFSTESKFKEITGEIMKNACHNLGSLNLSLDDIKKTYKSSEKAFYYYRNTKVLLWKLSPTLSGILLLGFLKDDYLDYDFHERSPELLKKLGPLIHKYYENNFKVNRHLNWIIGESPAMKRLKEQILKVSKVDFALLIRGESGSGKELVARGVHLLSSRSGKSFVAVNAAAIPENLLEAELFGYKKGAFTGAVENKKGLIEEADKGTLFLDEIADLPLNLQAKLLRVLQDNEIRRLGDIGSSKVDFRLICATNKDLKKLIKQNEFREDLYFRIQDLTIEVPPLVERTGDIPLLVHHFLEKYKFPVTDKSELQRISRYLEGLTWTGSVRELESTVKRMITYYPDFEMETEIDHSSISSASVSSTSSSSYSGIGLVAAKENLERTMIYNALKESDWGKNKAAHILKISRQYLSVLMKKYDIKE